MASRWSCCILLFLIALLSFELAKANDHPRIKGFETAIENAMLKGKFISLTNKPLIPEDATPGNACTVDAQKTLFAWLAHASSLNPEAWHFFFWFPYKKSPAVEGCKTIPNLTTFGVEKVPLKYFSSFSEIFSEIFQFRSLPYADVPPETVSCSQKDVWDVFSRWALTRREGTILFDGPVELFAWVFHSTRYGPTVNLGVMPREAKLFEIFTQTKTHVGTVWGIGSTEVDEKRWTMIKPDVIQKLVEKRKRVKEERGCYDLTSMLVPLWVCTLVTGLVPRDAKSLSVEPTTAARARPRGVGKLVRHFEAISSGTRRPASER